MRRSRAPEGHSAKPKFINKPLSNFDLLKWIDFLKIPNFKGIFARDELRPREHSPCIINLDSLKNVGTHWVCCVPGRFASLASPGDRALWYFDSFGLGFPQRIQKLKASYLEQQPVSKHQQRSLRILLFVFPPSMVFGKRFLRYSQASQSGGYVTK